MEIVLTTSDLLALTQGARREIVALLKLDAPAGPVEAAAESFGPEYDGIDMDEVVDLTFKQVQVWMEKASDPTKGGLRVFAEKGPVIHAKDLTAIGITNTAHFQSRTTIRTRTVTGNREAFLVGWDDWYAAEEGEGRYGVTPTTFRSLRRFFGLD